jgi:hypothetical protein
MRVVVLLSIASCAALTRQHRHPADEAALQKDVKELVEQTARAEQQRLTDPWRHVAGRVVKLETQLGATLDGPCAGPTPDKDHSEICATDRATMATLVDTIRRMSAPAAWSSELDRLRVLIDLSVRFQAIPRYADTAIGLAALPQLAAALDDALARDGGVAAISRTRDVGLCAVLGARPGAFRTQLVDPAGTVRARCGIATEWPSVKPWLRVRASRPEAAEDPRRVTYDEINRGGWRELVVERATTMTVSKDRNVAEFEVSRDAVVTALRAEQRMARGDFAIVEVDLGYTGKTGRQLVTRVGNQAQIEDETASEVLASGTFVIKWR